MTILHSFRCIFPTARPEKEKSTPLSPHRSFISTVTWGEEWRGGRGVGGEVKQQKETPIMPLLPPPKRIKDLLRELGVVGHLIHANDYRALILFCTESIDRCR